jgi:hypothetical protein
VLKYLCAMNKSKWKSYYSCAAHLNIWILVFTSSSYKNVFYIKICPIVWTNGYDITFRLRSTEISLYLQGQYIHTCVHIISFTTHSSSFPYLPLFPQFFKKNSLSLSLSSLLRSLGRRKEANRWKFYAEPKFQSWHVIECAELPGRWNSAIKCAETNRSKIFVDWN